MDRIKKQKNRYFKTDLKRNIWIQLIYRLDVVSAKLMNINYSGSSIGETRRQKMVFLFLPQEIIIEILLRLPVKSLPSFKFVCKS